VHRYDHTLLLWCCGAVVLWCCGAVVLWCCGAVVLWCCGAVVLRGKLEVDGPYNDAGNQRQPHLCNFHIPHFTFQTSQLKSHSSINARTL